MLNSQSATATNPFNKTNMTTLINMIYGSSGDMNTQITSLTSTASSTPITAKTLRAKTYNKTNGQSIVVRLGGLDWIVTYVSTDTSGNLVATLWLSNNHQEAWKGKSEGIGKYYGFVSGGLYSDWSADWQADTPSSSYPSNMYGTSYIRTETLNNPNNRTYTAKDGATSLTAAASQIKTLSGHPFALYTVSDFGLTNYITTPDQMKWMVNRQNPSAWGQDSYWRSNNSLTSNNAYNYSGSWYSSSYNYESKTGYANWGKDYLWLPSMVETGDDDTNDGMWETNTAERTTYDGSTTSLTASSSIGSSNSNGSSTTAYIYSWSRSAYTDLAYYSYFLSPSGSDYNYNSVRFRLAVRPALLLTLNSAAEHSELPPDFNVTVTNTNDSNSEYLDGNGDSYGSAYETDKCKLTVQFYTTSGTFVASQTFSTLTDSTINMGNLLTNNTIYRVRILAPTYMRYRIRHYIDTENDIYNEFSTSAFTVMCNRKQGIEVEVIGLQDNSWLTFYK